MAGYKKKPWVDDPTFLPRFCAAYLKNFSAREAAQAVGCAHSSAYRYLDDENTQAALQEMTRSVIDATHITVERILCELANGAFLDIAHIVDRETGVVHGNVHDIPEAARRTITEISQETVGDIVIRTKVKMMSKERCLELLGKYREIAMFKEVVETNATDEVARVRTSSLEDRVAGLEKDRVASMLKPE